MTINVHQVTAEKRLKSHDEQLMLIIPLLAVTICTNIVAVDVDEGCPLLGLARRPKGRFSTVVGLLSPGQNNFL
jgi:hypothetical protein